MQVLASLHTNATKMSSEEIIRTVLDKHKDKIVELNKKRLLEKGTDVHGNKIVTYGASGGNVYALKTIAIKEAKGQRTDRVTIKDKGKAHSSMKPVMGDADFKIEIDEDKDDGKISDNLDLYSAIGLSDQDMAELREEILPDIQMAVLDGLLR